MIVICFWNNRAQYKYLLILNFAETSLSSEVGAQMFPAVTICSNNPIKNSKIAEAEPASYRERLQKIPHNVERLLNESIYYTHKLKVFMRFFLLRVFMFSYYELQKDEFIVDIYPVWNG